ncbi:uroporphyrinogen-III synthase [Riemerella columbipharyngis]|uniref:Uroporphyrinogen-III synthase n=1 Tax=Riemerella columbipharyngis TaxID=1071918 RepID=A0A1G7B4B0_9FLAO|nr:uroporphyrinogen-III synthase [Riemerella columbipharyngis]SDE21929.1 uroporphyrinogen-III synthase [Riemerella columbipharyngis]
MKKILFTKQLETDLISDVLRQVCEWDFETFIEAKTIEIKPFDLENSSLIFTSANAVKAFLENHFKYNENPTYTVGKKTKNILEQNGIQVKACTENAISLAQIICSQYRHEAFIHFCGNLALDTLEKTLEEQNIPYQKKEIYTTKKLYPIIKKQYEAIVFFSPSGVESYFEHNENVKKYFCIGETTAKTLRHYTKKPIFVSENPTLDSILNLIKIKLS